MPEISRGRNVALIGRSDRESDRERAGEYYYRVTNRPDIPVRRYENSSSKARERELSLLYLASDFRQATGGCANEVMPRHLARFQPFETLMKGARWGGNRNEVGAIFHPEHLYTMDGRDINELSALFSFDPWKLTGHLFSSDRLTNCDGESEGR